MRRAGLMTAAAVALLLSGCGDSGDGDTAVTITEGKGGGTELLEAMTSAQLDAETATYEMSMTATGGGTEQAILDASGSMRLTSETTADMTMEMSMNDPAAGPVEMALNMVGGVVYTDMFDAMGAPVETTWVSIDPANEDPVSQLFAGFFGDQQAMADASAMLAENSDLVEVEEGEAGEVDGVEATEYLMTVSIDDMFEIGALSESQLGMDPSQLPMDSVTYSMWLDDSHLPLQIGFDMEIQDVTLVMDMGFADWGEPVTIEAPPESEVTDVSEAMAGVMGGEVTEEDLEMLEQTFGI